MSQYGTTSRETPNQGVPVWRFNNETYEVSRNIERNLMKRIYLTTALALLSSAAYAESNVNELRSACFSAHFQRTRRSIRRSLWHSVIAGCFKRACARTTVHMMTTAANVPV